MNKKSFSLIEILIVLIITGILVTFTVISFANWIERSRGNEALARLKSYADSIELCKTTGEFISNCLDKVPQNQTIGRFVYASITLGSSDTPPAFELIAIRTPLAIPYVAHPVTCGNYTFSPNGVDSFIILCSVNKVRTIIGVNAYEGI